MKTLLKLEPHEKTALWLSVAQEAAGALMALIVPTLVVAALYLAMRLSR